MALNTPQGQHKPSCKQGRNKVKNLPSRQIPELYGRLFGKEVKIRCRKKESGTQTCGHVCAATGRPPLFCRPGSADPSALGRLSHSSREGPQAREPAPAAATERKVRVRRCHEGPRRHRGAALTQTAQGDVAGVLCPGAVPCLIFIFFLVRFLLRSLLRIPELVPPAIEARLRFRQRMSAILEFAERDVASGCKKRSCSRVTLRLG